MKPAHAHFSGDLLLGKCVIALVGFREGLMIVEAYHSIKVQHYDLTEETIS